MARKERMTWDSSDTKKLLEICIQQKAGSSGRKTNWSKIVQSLNVATAKNFTEKQARNKYDDLKKMYKIWNEMELQWTGLSFDPESGCPQVEQDDRWAGFVKKHNGIPSRFLKQPLANLSFLRGLYSGTFATSKYSYSPGCGGEASLFGKGNETGTEGTGDSDDCNETELGGGNFDSTDNEESKSPPTTVSKEKRKSMQTPGSSKRKKDAIESCLELLKMSLVSGSSSAQVSTSKYSEVVRALNNLIEATISDEKGLPFRGRKGNKAWNVLASCSFDNLFTFVNVGFEGSAHDITVWSHSLSEPKFRFPHPPPGKYYLVDSGYPNTLGYLSPIRHEDVRYHMPEFRGGPPPNGMLEHFNYKHSSLRTIIERCFGVLKKRWMILKNMPPMEIKYQLAIMMSTFMLHNFIRLHELGIPLSNGVDVEPQSDTTMFNSERKTQMDTVQLNIAKEIWDSIRRGEENMSV